MALTKQEKTEVIEKVNDALKDSASVVFVNFHGLSVKDATDVRRALRNSEVGYIVAKKTLAKRALDEKKVEGEMPELPGELAIAYGSDLIAPAREVYSFQKKLADKISIVGGIFEGKYMNKEQMMEIALIPSRQTLYAQFVNLINSPIQGLVIALDAIANSKESTS
ncbi:MAG: 50S ribosomal protein L10 [Candidatus Paceibacterota bacterium]